MPTHSELDGRPPATSQSQRRVPKHRRGISAVTSMAPSEQTVMIGMMADSEEDSPHPDMPMSRGPPRSVKHTRDPSKAPSMVVNTQMGRSRAVSSIYSDAPFNSSTLTRPVPAPARTPAAYSVAEVPSESDFEEDTSDEEEQRERELARARRHLPTRKQRALEDEEHIAIVETAQAVTLSPSGAPRQRGPRTAVEAPQRKSKGWWNHIVSPFVSRSNTVQNANRGEHEQASNVPSLTQAAMRARGDERDHHRWDSQMSPDSPSTTNSDEWWEAWGADAKHESVVETTPYSLQQPPHIRDSPTHGQGSPITPAIAEHPLLRDFQTGRASQVHGSTVGPSRFATLRSQARSAVSQGDRLVPLRLEGSTPQHRPTPSRTMNLFGQSRFRDFIGLRSNAPSRAQTRIISRPIIQEYPYGYPANFQPTSEEPPPYADGQRAMPKYRAIFPPDHPSNRGPATGGLASPSARMKMPPFQPDIQMTEVDRTYTNSTSSTPSPAAVSLGSADYTSPTTQPFIAPAMPPQPSKQARKAEAKRRRHEKEEAAARKVGGCWRGRGCVPKSGCYGRSGREGRIRRRWYFLTILLILLIGAAVGVTIVFLHKNKKAPSAQSQWVNLTAFPPLLAGLSTVAQPANIVANSGCTSPSSLWSCALPRGLQTAGSPADQPNFLLNIQWDETAGDTGKSTASQRRSLTSATSFARSLLRRQAAGATSFNPNPKPPTLAEQAFLGETTDNVTSSDKAGEDTPFYISFGDAATTTIAGTKLRRRQNNFPNITAFIPTPNNAADGTAAEANLLPFPVQQPLRLYDRGLDTEHYGFYTYYDRSIFVSSLNTSASADANGGSPINTATYRCTWAQTRYLVQIWTKRNTTARLIGDDADDDARKAGAATQSASATDLTAPGSMPYPVTISIDRHGGTPALKMLYCYGMDDGGRQIATDGLVNQEDRGFGGQLANPAPSVFTDDDGAGSESAGYDGGTGGCACAWSNWQSVA